jgi:hypothetical protein
MGDVMEEYTGYEEGDSFRNYLYKKRKLDFSSDIMSYIFGAGLTCASALKLYQNEIELSSVGLFFASGFFLLPAFIRFSDYIEAKKLERKRAREERRLKRLESKVDDFGIKNKAYRRIVNR